MKELISINLFRTSKENIRKFCKEYKFGEVSAKELILDKSNGFATFWFEVTDKIKIVAFSKSDNQKKIMFNNEEMRKEYEGKLDDFPKYNPRKNTQTKKVVEIIESKSKSNDELEDNFIIDGILDKISYSGMDSLTKKEMNFLKSQSK